MFDKEQREHQIQMNDALKEHGIKYLDTNNNHNKKGGSDVPVGDMFKDGFKVLMGGNRQRYMLRMMERLIAINRGTVPLPIIRKLCWDQNPIIFDVTVKEKRSLIINGKKQ